MEILKLDRLEKIEVQYHKVLEYTDKKAHLPFWKAFLFAFMGGLFVGLGYVGYHFIAVQPYYNYAPLRGIETWQGIRAMINEVGQPNDLLLYKFLGSILFPVGLMLVLFLGGSLFTSNNLLTLGLLEKRIKVRLLAKDWTIIWFGNLAGTLALAGLNTAAGVYNSEQLKYFVNELADLKAQGDEWWNYFFSAIGCNILVSGTVFMAFYFKSGTGKILIIFFGIFLFAFSGYQHIVADFYAFGIAGFNSPDGIDWAAVIYANTIPVTIGNAIAGGLIIPLIYWLLNRKTGNLLKFGRKKKNG